MSSTYLIDGVGDEVTVLLGIFLAVFIVIVSWMSTRVSDTGAAVPFEINDPTQIHEIIRVRPSQHSATQSQNNRTQTATLTTESTSETPTSNNESITTDSTPTTSASNNSNDPQQREGASTSESSTQATENVLRQRIPPEPSASEQEQPNTSHSSNLVTIRLKFMNDTMKTVQASLDETLEHFRRKHFPPETANRYRLIHGGQVLRDGSRTLRDLNLSTVTNDGSPTIPVVHCFLSAEITPDDPNRPTNAAQQMEMTAEELHIGSFFLPIIGVVLLGLWYLCVFHTSLFSIQSLVSILGLTFLYVVLLVNQLL